MKLKITFFYALYNFLTTDQQKLELTSAQAYFLLQNIHILELPYLDSKKVDIVKNSLQYYFKDIIESPISVPEYEYKLIKNEFLNQQILAKTLGSQIITCELFDSIFKDYDIKYLNKVISPFIHNAQLVTKIVEILKFMNEFLCIGYKKTDNFLMHVIGGYVNKNSTIDSILEFFDYDFEINLVYTGRVDNYENFNNFINCEKVKFNRFLVKYNFESSCLKYEHLKLFLDICQRNHNFVNLLISDENSLPLQEKINIITCVLEKYESDPSYICPITTQLFNIYKHQKSVKTISEMMKLLDQYKSLPVYWCNNKGVGDEEYDSQINSLGDLAQCNPQND